MTTVPDNQAIVFVTGASRSGTTLLSRILGNHPAILRLNELHFFGDLCPIADLERNVPDARLERMAAMMLARQARDFWEKSPTSEEVAVARQIVAGLPVGQRTGANLYAATCAYLAAAAGKRMVCEQTPRNIFYAQQVLRLYGNARVIHMIRDPRAVLASQKNRWQMRRLGGEKVPRGEVVRLWFNYHPLTMSKLWLRATEAALALQARNRFRIQRFESLAAEPEITVRELCGWLGIDYQSSMLDVPQWGSSNIEHRGAGSGISTDMVEKWKDVLTDGEVAISERVTGPVLEELGYERCGDGAMGLSGWLQIALRYPLHVLGAVVTNPRRVLIQARAMLGGRDTAT